MTTAGLAGLTVVVTGAAGGMGRAITRHLVDAGCRVVGTDLPAADADGDPDIEFFAGDVSDDDHMRRVVDVAVDATGRLDAAVNAAAIEFETVPLAECTVEDYDRMMRVNSRGVFLSMKYELAAIVAAGNGGSIVNIASTNSFRPQHEQPAYTASKHAVLGLTRSAALDYARHGIRVNAVCPGTIDTPMLRNAMERRGRQPDDVARRLSPLGRFGDPTEIAQAVAWLCSPASSFTTGHALTVDGGMLGI